jgi:hypothetical protein
MKTSTLLSYALLASSIFAIAVSAAVQLPDSYGPLASSSQRI